MNKMLLSLAVGEPYERMLEITRPAMQKYAYKHGYVAALPNTKAFTDTERHPSWWKIEAMLRCFLAGVDLILWVDADVLIRDTFTEDIAYHLGRENLMGCVVHQTKNHGTVPNCGVWVVRKEFAPYLLKMNRMNGPGSLLNGSMWEQGALIELGVGLVESETKFPIILADPKPFPWAELPYEYNQIPHDIRGITPEGLFLHATGGKDLEERIRMLKEWAG